MNEIRPADLGLTRVGLRKAAFLGNCVAGNGRWYLSDGHSILRVSRCDMARLRSWECFRPNDWNRSGHPESRCLGLVDRALAGIVEDVREPVKLGTIRQRGRQRIIRVVRYQTEDGREVDVDAWKMRMVLYLTRADRVAFSDLKFTEPRYNLCPTFLRGRDFAGLVMSLQVPLRREDEIEWLE